LDELDGFDKLDDTVATGVGDNIPTDKFDHLSAGGTRSARALSWRAFPPRRPGSFMFSQNKNETMEKCGHFEA
jgi:hypothetical protein